MGDLAQFWLFYHPLAFSELFLENVNPAAGSRRDQAGLFTKLPVGQQPRQ